MECVDRVLADLGLPLAPRPNDPPAVAAARWAARAASVPLAWATRVT
jgi:hypothetical protein